MMILRTEWLLDTRHGADYFRRWHRNKNNSGGLMVHKATHHFDLVNWWIDSHPVEVSAMGDLDFYGRENAEERVRPRAPVVVASPQHHQLKTRDRASPSSTTAAQTSKMVMLSRFCCPSR